MNGDEIKTILQNAIDTPGRCGFEAYLIVKSDPRLKKINFFEGRAGDNDAGNFRLKIKDMFFEVLKDSFLHPDAQYTEAINVADNQKKFYIVPQDKKYAPFAFLNSTPGIYDSADLENGTGLAFKIGFESHIIWIYQHLWSILVPNKKKLNTLARIVDNNGKYLFTEQKEPLLTISKKIDILILDGDIVSSNTDLLQKSFGFQEFIKVTAQKTIDSIDNNDIVEDSSKLTEYMNRSKPQYAKKLMRISNSKVLQLPKDKLMENVRKSKRWNGKLQEKDGKFILNTYGDVELLIDLLDERYTVSEITGTEYDTDVKQVAEPINEGA